MESTIPNTYEVLSHDFQKSQTDVTLGSRGAQRCAYIAAILRVTLGFR